MRHALSFLTLIVCFTVLVCFTAGCSDGGSTLPPPGAGQLAIDVSASRTVGYGVLSTSFYVNITGGNPPYNIIWDFGDNSNNEEKAGQRVSHLFEVPGIFNVSCLVTDSIDTQSGTGGNTVHDFIEVTVFPPSV